MPTGGAEGKTGGRIRSRLHGGDPAPRTADTRHDPDPVQNLRRRGAVGVGGLRDPVVMIDGLAEARRFGETHGPRNRRFQDLVAVVLLDLPEHFGREGQASVVHRDEDAQNGEGRVVQILYAADRQHELDQALEREVFALHRDEHAVRRGQGVHRKQGEGRRAVDQDEVVRAAALFEKRGETPLPAGNVEELDLRPRKIQIGRDEGEILKGGLHDAFRRVRAVDENVVGGFGGGFLRDPDAARGVALRVDVDEEDAEPALGGAARDVDAGGGLSHASLLVGKRKDIGLLHGAPPPLPAPVRVRQPGQ